MNEHGSAEAALEALPAIANAAGVARYSAVSVEVASRELAAGAKLGARPLFWGEEHYPSALKDIPDPPPILWIMGQQALAARPMVAMVGARNASSLGTRMARNLAGGLAEAGFVVISGLARGVDTAAHLAALEGGTIAVQAGGIDVVYPQENAKLHEDIAATGLRLSEQPIGLQPMARHFPRRNRIISGCARAVIVVEAAAKSGSLITARNAADQGRDILAVPGNPMDRRASGCNMLIRDGALLIRSVEDVIEALSPLRHAPRPAPPADLREAPRPARSHAPAHSEILRRLGPAPVAEDQLIRDMALPAKSVISALTALEMEGRINRQPGGLLSLP